MSPKFRVGTGIPFWPQGTIILHSGPWNLITHLISACIAATMAHSYTSIWFFTIQPGALLTVIDWEGWNLGNPLPSLQSCQLGFEPTRVFWMKIMCPHGCLPHPASPCVTFYLTLLWVYIFMLTVTHIFLCAPLGFCVLYSSFFEFLKMKLAALNVLLCSKVCGEAIPLFFPGYKWNCIFFLNCWKGDELEPLRLMNI